ncbi:MAG TPA: VanZ family protein [Chryseolinea sp.]
MLLKKLWPALVWALFILALCALPGSAIPQLSFLDWLKPDKIVHLVLFGVLSFLLIRGLAGYEINSVWTNYPKTFSVIAASLYGVFVELLQEYFFEDRHGDVYDSIADALGAVTGLWFYNYRIKRIRKTA